MSYYVAKKTRELVEEAKIERKKSLLLLGKKGATIEKGDGSGANKFYEDLKTKLQEELKRENASNAKALKKKRGNYVQVVLWPGQYGMQPFPPTIHLLTTSHSMAGP